jgi:hypothetical protein
LKCTFVVVNNGKEILLKITAKFPITKTETDTNGNKKTVTSDGPIEGRTVWVKKSVFEALFGKGRGKRNETQSCVA